MFGLFSFVFDAIDSVVSQIFNFGRQIEDEVFGVINGFVQEVMGGAWRGTGANAFVQEMNDVVLPEVRNLIASLAGGGGGGGGLVSIINQAKDLIGSLDDALSSIGSAIGDVFDSIF